MDSKIEKGNKTNNVRWCGIFDHNWISSRKCLRMKNKYIINVMIAIIISALLMMFLLLISDEKNNVLYHYVHKLDNIGTIMPTLIIVNGSGQERSTSSPNMLLGEELLPQDKPVDYFEILLTDGETPMVNDNSDNLVILPNNVSQNQQNEANERWKKFKYVNDNVGIQRSIPDFRNEKCQTSGELLKSVQNITATSIVICFHNEIWSVLLRTVHSVLNNSPENLIKEIILVDDFSDKLNLKSRLVEHFMDNSKVKVIRTIRREGLIGARLIGLREVTASIVTFLNSHCECLQGWLEPLLFRIAHDRTIVASPVIDDINVHTLQWEGSSEKIYIGGLNWNFELERTPPLGEHMINRSDTVWNPTIIAGIYAIDKAFFEELGTYDAAFDSWSAHLELSFKVWLCSGTMEIMPCSRVGQLVILDYEETSKDKLTSNLLMLAEGWLDDYVIFFHRMLAKDIELTDQDLAYVARSKELQSRLGCYPFEWYMKNINPGLKVPDHISQKRRDIAKHLLSMQIIMQDRQRGGMTEYFCLDANSIQPVISVPLSVGYCHAWGKQLWLLSDNGEIKLENTCLDSSYGNVFLYHCHNAKGTQLWVYEPDTKLLKNGGGAKCLESDLSTSRVSIRKCNHSDVNQMWEIRNYRKAIRALRL